jgi:hypothetical protein
MTAPEPVQLAQVRAWRALWAWLLEPLDPAEQQSAESEPIAGRFQTVSRETPFEDLESA